MILLRHPFTILLYMLLGSAVPLLFALIIQYGFGYPPCEWCMYQRYPYALILAICLFTFVGLHIPGWAHVQGGFAIAAWLTTSALGFYHFAIERG